MQYPHGLIEIVRSNRKSLFVGGGCIALVLLGSPLFDALNTIPATSLVLPGIGRFVRQPAHDRLAAVHDLQVITVTTRMCLTGESPVVPGRWLTRVIAGEPAGAAGVKQEEARMVLRLLAAESSVQGRNPRMRRVLASVAVASLISGVACTAPRPAGQTPGHTQDGAALKCFNFGPGPNGTRTCQMYNPSLLELLIVPGPYWNRPVTVSGYLSNAFEDRALYRSREAYERMSAREALWLHLTDAQEREYMPLDGRYVDVIATFRRGRPDRTEYGGELFDITVIARNEFHRGEPIVGPPPVHGPKTRGR